MKFPTATIYMFIWLCPIVLAGQQKDIVLPKKIKPVRPSVANEEYFERDLQRVRKEEALLSLELVRVRLETALYQAETADGGNAVPSVLAEKEKALSEQLARLRSYRTLLEETRYWPDEKRQRALAEWNTFPGPIGEKENTGAGLVQGMPIDVRPPVKKNYAVFRPEHDLMAHPPGPSCAIQRQFSGKKNKIKIAATAPQLIFSHTDKKLEQYFPKRNFITGYGSLRRQTGGMLYLNLTVVIASPKAGSLFGIINRGAPLVLTLLDGTNIHLRNQLPATSGWDARSHSYLYQCSFPIGIKEERLLRAIEVDKIQVVWSKASDEYEIFELDFFINHLNCLENG